MAETSTAPHYLVDSSGNHFYPVNAPYFTDTAQKGPRGQAGDREIEVKVAELHAPSPHSYHRTTWYMTSEPVTAFVWDRPPVKETIQWRLKDESAASARFPLTLTPEQYKEQRALEDPDDDDVNGLTYVMYRAITEDKPVEPYVLDVSAMTEIVGTADVHQDWVWEAERTAGLTYGSWYHHLLPGTLHGVKARMAKDLEARYGKADFFGRRVGFNADSRGKFEVTMHLEYDKPVITTKPRYGAGGRKLKGTQSVKEFFRMDVEWAPVGQITSALGKAAAVRRYNEILAETIEWIDSHALVVCHNCKGNGYTKAITAPKP